MTLGVHSSRMVNEILHVRYMQLVRFTLVNFTLTGLLGFSLSLFTRRIDSSNPQPTYNVIRVDEVNILAVPHQ